jgi:hypothetical protein
LNSSSIAFMRTPSPPLRKFYPPMIICNVPRRPSVDDDAGRTRLPGVTERP